MGQVPVGARFTMLDLTQVPPREAAREAHEQYLSAFVSAFEDGLEAVRAIASGGPPNVDALDGYAQALETLRMGEVSDGHTRPAEDDVHAARSLVELARTEAPREEVIALASRVIQITHDGRGHVAGSSDGLADPDDKVPRALVAGFACLKELAALDVDACAPAPDPTWAEKLRGMEDALREIATGQHGPSPATMPERIERVGKLRSLVEHWTESGQSPERLAVEVERVRAAFRPPAG